MATPFEKMFIIFTTTIRDCKVLYRASYLI